MSKGKGKRSNRQVVSRERIAQASYAKSKGLISKSAKLGNNKLSRRVAKKILALEELGAVPTFEFRPGAKRASILDKPKLEPIKLKANLRRKMLAQGYEIFGGNALVPKGDKRFKEALSQGRPAGIKRFEDLPRIADPNALHRVTADTVEVIALDTMGIRNYADLHRALRGGDLDSEAKLEDEVYAFTVFGYHPRGSMTFFTGDELAEYLERYKWTDEFFDNFELVRLQEGGSLGPTPDDMYKRNRRRRRRTPQEKRTESIKLRAQKIKDERNVRSQEFINEQTKARMQKYRQRIASDPQKAEQYRRNENERKRRVRKESKDRK